MYARDHGVIATPIGPVRVEGDDELLVSVRIGEGTPSPGTAATVRAAIEQLKAWFAGERQDFDLPLQPLPTPRGEELRQAMIGIGYGETLSYGGLARLTGSSARAIGQICSNNPSPSSSPATACSPMAASSAIIRAGTDPRPNPGCSSMSAASPEGHCYERNDQHRHDRRQRQLPGLRRPP
jgi:methylated-DNA-[protein]-cysteine S-methyltransferase